MKQIEGQFTNEEKSKFQKLTELETEAKTGPKMLNTLEYDRYLELSKMDKYTSEESNEFIALHARLEKTGKTE